ncbi:hypothetical protein G7Y89_g14543 [Cudoniella acicularis]|uniref:DUF676 domain-containing protein n=1 Tax=Cudoniella acicularis TaxID=354080 RepID=A0A8H4R335_9HELO|nr:hypothetical protein G7Y89_g14543 [Cudoniella acicularis]
MWNVFGARTLLTSGRQLFMIDKFRSTGRPLLEILADPNSIFIQGLAKFQRRTLYTNILNDRSAVYYTTSISKTDPFTNLDKMKIEYLKGYEDIILDPSVPPRLITEVQESNALSARVLRETQTSLMRLPFLFALISYIPVGMITVLVNSGIQALESHRRIRRYEMGLTEIQPSAYRVPLFLTRVQGTIGDVYESVNNAQSHEYLPAGSEEASLLDEEELIPKLNRAGRLEDGQSEYGVGSEQEGVGGSFATLALAPTQFRMIRHLDEVGWRKFPVHIRRARHTHAAVIVRTDKPSFEEGWVVLRHWVEEEFIL